MSDLSLYFLGSPQIELDGVSVNIRYSKTLAMLIYLAVSGEAQRRDTLATLLWSESSQIVARSSLRRELSQLKKALKNNFLVIDRETIALSSAIWLDVTQFRQILLANQHENVALDDLTKAIELYRDDFLKGFTLPDCPEFSDWQLFETESLRQLFSNALQQLTTELSRQEQYEKAIPYARRWLALDPLLELAHRMLMRLYALSGRQAAALHQFNNCQRILADELDIEPDEETQALAQAIQARELHPSHAKARILTQTENEESETTIYIADSRPLFVGRESQINNLEQALERTLNKQGQVRFIVGEAGAGKSALVTEFIQRTLSLKTKLLIASGFCDAQTGLIDPYLPFREALRNLIIESGGIGSSNFSSDFSFPTLNPRASQKVREVTSRALLEHGAQLLLVFFQESDRQSILNLARQIGWEGEAPQPDTQKIEQSVIFEQLVMVMQAIADEFPLILVLEDLHWVDSGSMGILYRLATQLTGHRILLLGTYRPEAIRVVEEGNQHPLQKILPELQRKLSDFQIDLDAVRTQEGQLLVDDILNATPNRLEESFRQAFYHQTGGHPLFVVELLQDLKEAGGLIQDEDDYWVLGNRLDWLSLPTRVEGAIAGRMAHLTDSQQWLLTIASVMGENFVVEIIAHIAGEDSRQVSQILSRTLQFEHRLVEAQGVERLANQRLTKYRFRHNLMQVYLYESLDDVQRVYLHEDIARTLEVFYGEEIELISLTLAYHYQSAGLIEQAIHYLIIASKESNRVAAFEESYQHLTRALSLLLEVPEGNMRDRTELVIQRLLGEFWSARKGATVPEVGIAYRRALDLSHKLGATREAVELLFELTQYTQMRMEVSQAKKYGEESLQLLEESDDPELHMQVNKSLHNIAQSEGLHFDAVKYNSNIIAFYRKHRPNLTSDDTIHLAYALTKHGINLAPCGYPEQALTCASEGTQLMKHHGTPLNIGGIISLQSFVHMMCRDWQTVINLTDQSLEIAHQHDIPQMRTFAGMNQGIARAMLGDFEAGINLALEAIEERRRFNSPFGELITLMHLAQAYVHNGKAEDGLALINDVLDRFDEIHEYMCEPMMYHIKGVLLLNQNLQGTDLQMVQQEAEQCFRQSIDISRSRKTKLWEVRALAGLCQLLHSQGRNEGTYQQLAELYAWFTEGFETEDLRIARTILQQLA